MRSTEEQLAALTVGSEVVVARSGSWDVHYTAGYKVIRITPTGRIVVKYQSKLNEPALTEEKTFDCDGDEIGKGYTRRWLIADVAAYKAMVAAKQQKADACTALRKAMTACEEIGGNGYSKEALLRKIEAVEIALAEAKALALALAD